MLKLKEQRFSRGVPMKVSIDERLSRFFNKENIRKIVVSILAIQMTIGLVSMYLNIWLGIVVFILFLAMDFLLWRVARQATKELNLYISNLSYRIKRAEHEAIIKLPIGIVIYNDQEEIEWMSPYLQTGSGDEASMIGKKVSDVFNGIKEALDTENNSYNEIEWRGNYYRIRVEEDIKTIYFENVTSYMNVKDELEENRPVLGWLFLDNYDDVIKGLDDRAISNFNSLLTTYLSNWARQHNIYYKRFENDKYLLLLRFEELKRLEREKFNIVNNIREYTSKRNLPLTISIGMSYGKASFNDLATFAQKDLDLALGRGGDQAIVREIGEEPKFYGGTTNPMEKRTRVRSRMISEALQEQIKQAPTTYVMGHQYPDMDSIGSSLGVARIAMMLDKECKIIIDQEKIGNDIKKMLEKVKKYQDSYRNIISPEEAFTAIKPDDLVVLVDHHKPSMSIAPKLNEKAKNLVIIDHHRRGDEFPEKPTLVYIEPYASSAAELTAELFEYVSTDRNTINRIEATALLGGIIVDTNNFTLRTGSRTFDAASYLQSVGANTTTIQRILKEDPENYLKRMKLIETLEFVAEGSAVAHGSEEETYRQVTAAQTADTMLSMTGVESSFVIVRIDEDTIGISARSLGTVNVQRIMEQLGGGGHLTNAATQIKGQTIKEVKEQLVQVIKEASK